MVSKTVEKDFLEVYKENVAEHTKQAIYNKTGILFPAETKKEIRKLYKMSVPAALHFDEKTKSWNYNLNDLEDAAESEKSLIDQAGVGAAAWFLGDAIGMVVSSSPTAGISPETFAIGGALMSVLAVPMLIGVTSFMYKRKAEKLRDFLTANQRKLNHNLPRNRQMGSETLMEG